MEFTILAALSENRVIGNNNQLPWYIPEDLKRFKQLTLDHTVIMGRKTYESILQRLQQPLPQRKNIVLTRNLNDSRVLVARSLEEALSCCGQGENFVIGGEQIFNLFFPLTSKLELTFVNGSYVGDSFFPEINNNEWRLTREDKKAAYSFQTYHKITHSP